MLILLNSCQAQKSDIAIDRPSFTPTQTTNAPKVGRTEIVTPPPITDGAMAYDSQRTRIVLYGWYWIEKENEQRHAAFGTWEYFNGEWYQVETQEHPRVGRDPVMTYFPKKEKFVLYGSTLTSENDVSELWEFDGKSWDLNDNMDLPEYRENAGFAYDPMTESLLLVGGWKNGIEAHEVWRYDGEVWTFMSESSLITQDNKPIQFYAPKDTRLFTSFNNLVLLDIFPARLQFFTYESTTDTWTLSYRPTTRSDFKYLFSGVAYDPNVDAFIIFGGKEFQAGNLIKVSNETWLMNSNGISSLSTHNSPSARFDPFMVYSHEEQAVILFGGETQDGTYLNDTWKYQNGEWIQLYPNG